jgi:hypothetical protein
MSTHLDHPAALAPEQLAAECETRRTRRSGPGGQNRNKVETAVVVIHGPSGVSAEASERRSQAENRRVALHRLRLKLAIEVRRPWGVDRLPSLLWSSRCRGGRLIISSEHDDFPSILAEALDAVGAHVWDVKAAAQDLRCTSSQLLRLLRSEPRAFVRVNEGRRQVGLRPLH